MTINIDGNILELTPLEKSECKGLWAEARWLFTYYACSFCGIDFIVAASKTDVTPLQLEHYAARLGSFFGKPVVFSLPEAPRYQRARYAQRGLFYMMPDKGYARLPFLYAGKKISDRMKAKALTPAAQYLLLYHLQQKSLEGLSVSEICEIVPQSYLTVSRAVTTLEDIGLARGKREGKSKYLQFASSGRALWEKAQPYLISPVSLVRYTDHFDRQGIIGGINALAHYTMLNPEEMQTLVVEREDFPAGPGLPDGRYRIEAWKYPPVGNGQWVDRLSLAISLRDDKDDRVQKEIEIMVDKIWSTE